MRLFLGIEVPEDIKRQIYTSLLPIKTGAKGWEDPHDYHLTLLFIGPTHSESLPHIISTVKGVTFPPFSLTLRNFVFFNRRVMYLSFDPSPMLLQLKDQLEQKFPEYLNPHPRPFVPHITIKRWQRYEFDELFKRISENPFQPKSFEASRLSLFKAEKNLHNQKYHVIWPP